LVISISRSGKAAIVKAGAARAIVNIEKFNVLKIIYLIPVIDT